MTERILKKNAFKPTDSKRLTCTAYLSSLIPNRQSKNIQIANVSITQLRSYLINIHRVFPTSRGIHTKYYKTRCQTISSNKTPIYTQIRQIIRSALPLFVRFEFVYDQIYVGIVFVLRIYKLIHTYNTNFKNINAINDMVLSLSDKQFLLDNVH